MRVLDDAVELDLRPRFPLFGGWKTHYVMGYNVPSYEYLYNSGNDFVLQMRLLDHIFDDMLVEDFTLKIILPEGCSVGKFISAITILHVTFRTGCINKMIGDLLDKSCTIITNNGISTKISQLLTRTK